MAKRKNSRSKKVVSRRPRPSASRGKELHQLAHYAFIAGIILAVITGIFRNVIAPEILMTTLVIIGFFVGLFNLTAKETTPFLVACIALMLAGIVNLSLIPVVGVYLRQTLSNIVVFVVPAAILVGLKAVWALASD